MSQTVLRLTIKIGEGFRHAVFKGHAFFSKPWLARAETRASLARRTLLYQALNNKTAWHKTVVVIDLNTWEDDEVEALRIELDANAHWLENENQRKFVQDAKNSVTRYQKSILRRLAKAAP